MSANAYRRLKRDRATLNGDEFTRGIISWTVSRVRTRLWINAVAIMLCGHRTDRKIFSPRMRKRA